MPQHSAGSQQFWCAWLPHCAGMQGCTAAHCSPGPATRASPGSLWAVVAEGAFWSCFGEASEHKQEMPAQPLFLIAGCPFATLQQQVWCCRNPLSTGELRAVPSVVQTSASSLPSPCFLHRCLLLQLEESSKGNQSLKQAPGRERVWVEVSVTQ